MKKTGLIVILMSALAFNALAQTPDAEPKSAPKGAQSTPTESDMYCSGYLAAQPVPKTSYIAGAWDTPIQGLYADRDYIYLTGGSYQTGAKYQIVRGVRDFTGYEVVKNQKKKVAATGIPYEELGRVRVIDVQKNIGIAVVEFSCNAFQPGDLAIPWVEKPAPTFRAQTPFNRFAPPNGKLTGHIVMAKEFDYLLGAKNKVYLDVGSNKGVKVGDYFRATRTYAAILNDPSDGMATKTYIQDPSKAPTPLLTKEQLKADLPRRSLGEMIVIYTTPVSATAMITSNIEAIQVGDDAEMMEEPPPPPPPPPPAAMNPPTVTCSAEPATVRAGETATVRCSGASADNRPLSYTFVSDTGTVTPRENVATVDTKGVAPGVITVMTTATDDRNLSSSTNARITVEAPPAAPQASRMGEFLFRPNSAYVDNRAKAVLDGVALRLQQEANSSVVLVGSSALAEAARLGIARATNAKTYLTKDKGIDGSRIQLRDGGKGGRRVEIWFVPAGAAMPDIKPIAAPAAPAAKKPTATKKPSTKTAPPK